MRWSEGACHRGGAASMGNPTRKKTAGPAGNMDLGRSAPGLGRCVARLSSTMAGPRSHLCAQATLVGLPSPTAGAWPRCRVGLEKQRGTGWAEALPPQWAAGRLLVRGAQVPLDPPAQACKMQLHICQLPMSGGDGPPPSSPGITGAGRPLRRLGGFGDEGEPPPAPALHAQQYAHAPLLCSG